jgi:hypothetical protein
MLLPLAARRLDENRCHWEPKIIGQVGSDFLSTGEERVRRVWVRLDVAAADAIDIDGAWAVSRLQVSTGLLDAEAEDRVSAPRGGVRFDLFAEQPVQRPPMNASLGTESRVHLREDEKRRSRNPVVYLGRVFALGGRCARDIGFAWLSVSRFC